MTRIVPILAGIVVVASGCTDRPSTPADSRDAMSADSRDAMAADSGDAMSADSRDAMPADSGDTTPADSRDAMASGSDGSTGEDAGAANDITRDTAGGDRADAPPSGRPVINPTTGAIQNPAVDPGDNTPTEGCRRRFYFDNNTGDDGRSCDSIAAPCKSVTRSGQISYQPGDCILYARGSTWTNEPTDWASSPSGTETSKITYGSYGAGERPIIRYTSDFPSLNFTDKSHLVFDRLDVRGVEIIRFRGSHHILVRLVRMADIRKNAFRAERTAAGPARFITFDRVAVEGTGLVAGSGPVNGLGEGFYLSGGGTPPETWGAEDITITGCYVTRSANEPISWKQETRRIIVQGCLIEGNRRADDPGFISNQQSNLDNAGHIIRGNVIRNNGNEQSNTHPAILAGRGTRVENNVIYGNAQATCYRGVDADTFALHNTCAQALGFSSGSNETPDANMKNNIGLARADNLGYEARYFVDPAANNYRLAPGTNAAVDLYSNCRGVTIDIEGNARPVNAACDAGAFERGAATP